MVGTRTASGSGLREGYTGQVMMGIRRRSLRVRSLAVSHS
uniref:Uncharacterized protein n=1 Tax=Rhizophora mucronata TaxID=61149 RepID=A0A2P2QS37_RHIMU